jgi:hypothetical protein
MRAVIDHAYNELRRGSAAPECREEIKYIRSYRAERDEAHRSQNPKVLRDFERVCFIRNIFRETASMRISVGTCVQQCAERAKRAEK